MNSLNVFRGSNLSKDRNDAASQANRLAHAENLKKQKTINNKELLEEYLTTAELASPPAMTPVSTDAKETNTLNKRLRKSLTSHFQLITGKKSKEKKSRAASDGAAGDVRLEHLCMGSTASIPQRDLADSDATEIAQLSGEDAVSPSSPSPAFSTSATNDFSNRADSDVSDCDSIDSPESLPAVVRYLNQFVLWPEGGKRIAWDCIQAVIILYLAVMIPYRMGFNVRAMGYAYLWEFSCDVYFYMDIFVNFFTAFWRETDIDTVFVCDVRDIAIHYLSTWFFIDAVACLPLDLISKIVNDKFLCSFAETGCGDEGGSSGAQALRLLKLFRMFRLLKLIHLMRVGRMLERWQDQLIFIDSLVTLLKTAVTMFLLSHWLGCLYATAYIFERNELGYDGTDTEYAEYDTTTAYVGMLYWAVQTVTTVGYGNISAYSVDEQLIAIAAMLIGGFVFSWLITSIFNSLNPDSTQRRLADRMSRVLEYLRGHQLPRDLATRILSYYRKQNNTTFDEKQLHRELPTVLRFELFSHLYYPCLQKVPALGGADIMFLNQVCAELGLVTFPSVTAIYNFDDFCEELYIIKSGTVNIFKGGPMSEKDRQRSSNRTKSPSNNPHDRHPPSRLKTMNKDEAIVLSPGAYFGESGCLGYSKRTENAVTQSVCVLFTMNTESFRLLLNTAPDVKTKMLLGFLENLNSFTARPKQYEVLKAMQLTHLCDANDDGLRDDWKNVITEARKDEEKQDELDFLDNSGSSDPIMINLKMGFQALWNNQDSLRQEMTILGKQIEMLRTALVEAQSRKGDAESSSPRKKFLEVEEELVMNEERDRKRKSMINMKQMKITSKTIKIIDEAVTNMGHEMAEEISNTDDVPLELGPTTSSTGAVLSSNNVSDAVNAQPAQSGASEIDNADLSSHQL